MGKKPIVVEEGLRKSAPNKLYIIHTPNELDYQYETEAKKLKTKVEEERNITTELVKVDAFDMDQIIKTILTTIIKERRWNTSLTKRDFAINITGGTKLMVAAASTAAYLAGSRVLYVREPSKYRGDDLVKELPMPIQPENDNRGNTSKTTTIILEKIRKFGKCTNQMLLDEVQKDPRLKKSQRIEYHLKKLEEYNLISIRIGWEKPKKNPKTGKPGVDRKKRTISLTPSGEYHAEFPGLMGNIS
jgi:Family of unknown function (DUF6293)